MITNLNERIVGAVTKITGKIATEIFDQQTLGELGLTNPSVEHEFRKEIYIRTGVEFDLLNSKQTLARLIELINHEKNVAALTRE